MPDHHRLASTTHPRDDSGQIRLTAYQADYDRLVGRAFEKIRQSGRDMPAVMIRQLDALAKILRQTTIPQRRQLLLDQATLIHRANLATVAEEADRNDVQRHYEALLDLYGQLAGA